jgi:ABC-type transporter Mla subunit MlaD
MIAAFGWSDLAYLALAVFLLLTGLALAYGALRLGGTLGRASSLLQGTERELLPVISKLGSTVDRVNEQLDKVDQITDSAVDAVAGVDAAVRAVTGVVSRPIEKLAGAVAGIRHGASSLRAGGAWHDAVHTGKEEAARREQDLADELGGEE